MLRDLAILFFIGEAYLKQIRNWPKISPNDGPGLRDFSDFLEHCRTAMSNIQYLDILNSAAENKTMYLKLPTYLVQKWSEIVKEWVSRKASVRRLCIRHFLNFVNF